MKKIPVVLCIDVEPEDRETGRGNVSDWAGVEETVEFFSTLRPRLEQATGAPSDPELVKRLAVDLYLNPKRKLRLEDDKLRVVRLTRKWLLSGVFGRKTGKRATRALTAAEQLDAAAIASQWKALRRNDPSPKQAS